MKKTFFKGALTLGAVAFATAFGLYFYNVNKVEARTYDAEPVEQSAAAQTCSGKCDGSCGGSCNGSCAAKTGGQSGKATGCGCGNK